MFSAAIGQTSASPMLIDQDRAGATGQGRIAAANRLGIGASFAGQTCPAQRRISDWTLADDNAQNQTRPAPAPERGKRVS